MYLISQNRMRFEEVYSIRIVPVKIRKIVVDKAEDEKPLPLKRGYEVITLLKENSNDVIISTLEFDNSWKQIFEKLEVSEINCYALLINKTIFGLYDKSIIKDIYGGVLDKIYDRHAYSIYPYFEKRSDEIKACTWDSGIDDFKIQI